MDEASGLNRRRFPRFPVRHPVDGSTGVGRLPFRGMLRDLSQEGCRLELDGSLPPGTPIDVRCNINGLGLRLHGETAWVDAPGGLLHGVAITGFASAADALFHRLYLERLARARPASAEAD